VTTIEKEFFVYFMSELFFYIFYNFDDREKEIEKKKKRDFIRVVRPTRA